METALDAATERRRVPRSRVFRHGRLPLAVTHHVLGSGPVHSHDHEFIELVVVVSGSAMHQSIDGQSPLRRGHAIVLRPGQWHAYRHCRRLNLYNCYIGTELLEHELAWALRQPRLRALLAADVLTPSDAAAPLLKLSESSLRICRRHLRTLASQHATPLQAIGTLLLILHELAAACPDVDADQPQAHPAVGACVQLLAGAIDKPWTLAELSRSVHVSQSHLIRVFRAQTGLSPMQYLSQLRARRAAALLLRTAEPVARIGAAVGWDDPNYFARRFRLHWGLSPSAYRTRNA